MFCDLNEFAAEWQDTPESHIRMNRLFTQATDECPSLHAHRKWAKENWIGFGEDSFQSLWGLIVRELPATFSFLEIGVHRGQITSLIGMLAHLYGKKSTVVGISPFDGSGLGWEKPLDLYDDTWQSWKEWVPEKSMQKQVLYRARSDAPGLNTMVYQHHGLIDCLYVDGSHAFEDVRNDILLYAPLVKQGGLLVMDDAACSMQIPNGYFPGILEVTKATDELLPRHENDSWKHLGSLVHLRVWRAK